MPVYESQCQSCGAIRDYYATVSDRDNTPICCGEKTQKVILSAPMGYCENIHYQSPITGRPITTKQQRIDDLVRSGSRPWEGMEQEVKVAKERVKQEEKEQDKKIEEAVVGAWNQLPSEKRRLLETAA